MLDMWQFLEVFDVR